MNNGMWRKIWIRDIEGILMMLKRQFPENGGKEDLRIIERLNSRFPHSDLDLEFLRPKISN
jgi:hypothetical protein